MSSNIDYRAVEIPPDKPPTEYTYAQRRAELLQQVIEAGHPRAINQTELADRYGVSQQQVSKDMDRLSEFVAEHVGSDHRFILESVYHGAMLNLVEEGEYFKAVQVARWWGEWLADVGAMQTEARESGTGEIDVEFSEEEIAMLDSVTSSAGSDRTIVENAAPGDGRSGRTSETDRK